MTTLRVRLTFLAALLLLAGIGIWQFVIRWPAGPPQDDPPVGSGYVELIELNMDGQPLTIPERLTRSPGTKIEVSGTLASDPDLWVKTLQSPKRRGRMTERDFARRSAELSGRHNLSLYMTIVRSQFSTAEPVAETEGPARVEFGDDGRITFEGNLEIPGRRGEYEFRMTLSVWPNGEIPTFDNPEHLVRLPLSVE